MLRSWAIWPGTHPIGGEKPAETPQCGLRGTHRGHARDVSGTHRQISHGDDAAAGQRERLVRGCSAQPQGAIHRLPHRAYAIPGRPSSPKCSTTSSSRNHRSTYQCSRDTRADPRACTSQRLPAMLHPPKNNRIRATRPAMRQTATFHPGGATPQGTRKRSFLNDTRLEQHA